MDSDSIPVYNLLIVRPSLIKCTKLFMYVSFHFVRLPVLYFSTITVIFFCHSYSLPSVHPNPPLYLSTSLQTFPLQNLTAYNRLTFPWKQCHFCLSDRHLLSPVLTDQCANTGGKAEETLSCSSKQESNNWLY